MYGLKLHFYNYILAGHSIMTKMPNLIYILPCPRFYSDSETWTVDRQFLWGKYLLITPVLDPVS